MNLVNANRYVFFLFATMFACFLIVNFVGPSGIRKTFIDGDGSGHYAYLPAIFIHHSVDFTPVFEVEKAKRSLDYQGHYFHEQNGVLINKFSLGTALLQLPFFLLAWLVSIIFGLSADGYNLLFQYAVAVSAFLWVFIGLVFLTKLAALYGAKRQTAWIIALMGLLGTNLFFYTFLAPSMSHAYSFSLISIFLYFLKKSFENYSRKTILISAFLLGLIVLVRPVNLIVVAAIPFLAGSFKSLFFTIRKKVFKFDFIPALLLFVLALSPQLIINYLQTGNLFVLGYKNEGFNFSNPEVVNFLVSYRKGWLVYTPFMLLLIPSLVILYKRTKYEFFSFLLFFVLLIYVFSSWWNWLFGDSFGMRPMVDFYALFLLLIILFADTLTKRFYQIGLGIFITFTSFLNLFQTYQYSKGILHPDSMTQDAYWYVFLKTGQNYEDVIGDFDEYFYGELSKEPFLKTTADYINTRTGWSKPGKTIRDDTRNHEVVLMDENAIYSPAFRFAFPDSLFGRKNLYVKFNLDYLELEKNAGMNCLFVVDISDSTDDLLFYKTFRVKRLPTDVTGIWQKGQIGFKLPVIKPEMQRLTLYIWNRDKQNILLDSLQIEFYTYAP